MEVRQNTKGMNVHKVMVAMSPAEHKKYLAFLSAEKVVQSVKKGLKELKESQERGVPLKSAFELANEL